MVIRIHMRIQIHPVQGLRSRRRRSDRLRETLSSFLGNALVGVNGVTNSDFLFRRPEGTRPRTRRPHEDPRPPAHVHTRTRARPHISLRTLCWTPFWTPCWTPAYGCDKRASEQNRLAHMLSSYITGCCASSSWACGPCRSCKSSCAPRPPDTAELSLKRGQRGCAIQGDTKFGLRGDLRTVLGLLEQIEKSVVFNSKTNDNLFGWVLWTDLGPLEK